MLLIYSKEISKSYLRFSNSFRLVLVSLMMPNRIKVFILTLNHFPNSRSGCLKFKLREKFPSQIILSGKGKKEKKREERCRSWWNCVCGRVDGILKLQKVQHLTSCFKIKFCLNNFPNTKSLQHKTQN